MTPSKECIAMMLAGGQGSRLCSLTNKKAKPAIPFGAKYRIIDFALSNCTNSKIDTVGILTQYCPLELSEYLGNGKAWKLDRKNSGLTILPPYSTKKGAEWYKGTANAIYQNLEYIAKFNPKYVLILSADQVYKMNYQNMLEEHKSKNADLTISVIDVPLQDASRFGIMQADDTGRITDFEEKPPHPKSTLASMGIYIFNTNTLFEYLNQDNCNPQSSNDFGKDIIPKMIEDKLNVYAYKFDGYWRDVGTLESYWECNMDLLDEGGEIDIFSDYLKIYSGYDVSSPAFIGEDACIKSSLVSDNTVILGKVENSIIFSGVRIESFAEVKDSIIFENVLVEEGAKINYSIIDSDSVICEGVKIGNELSRFSKLTVTETRNRIRKQKNNTEECEETKIFL